MKCYRHVERRRRNKDGKATASLYISFSPFGAVYKRLYWMELQDFIAFSTKNTDFAWDMEADAFIWKLCVLFCVL